MKQVSCCLLLVVTFLAGCQTKPDYSGPSRGEGPKGLSFAQESALNMGEGEGDASQQLMANLLHAKIMESFGQGSKGGEISYADYYGGAFTDSLGNLTFLIKGDLKRGKANILSVVQSEKLKFVPCQFSYQELEDVMKSLSRALSSSPKDVIGNVSMYYVSVQENRVVVGLRDCNDDKIRKFKQEVSDHPALTFVSGFAGGNAVSDDVKGRVDMTVTSYLSGAKSSGSLGQDRATVYAELSCAVFSLDDLTKRATLTIVNPTDVALETGSEWFIERRNGDKWESLPRLSDKDLAWHALGYVVKPHGKQVFNVSLLSFIYQYEPGHYRFKKQVKTQSNLQEPFYVYAEFEVVKREDISSCCEDSIHAVLSISRLEYPVSDTCHATMTIHNNTDQMLVVLNHTFIQKYVQGKWCVPTKKRGADGTFAVEGEVLIPPRERREVWVNFHAETYCFSEGKYRAQKLAWLGENEQETVIAADFEIYDSSTK